MDYNELARLAMSPGPMQQLALDKLLSEYEADNRVDAIHGRGAGLDPERYAREYSKAAMEQMPPIAPVGDYSPQDSREYWADRAAYRDLMDLYDTPWYDKAMYAAKAAPGILWDSKKELAEAARDTFVPVYTQMDSARWSADEYGKFLDSMFGPMTDKGYRDRVDEYGQPSTATIEDMVAAGGHGALSVLGALGTIPGVASVIGGGRKLGKGWRALMEGFI